MENVLVSNIKARINKKDTKIHSNVYGQKNIGTWIE
jgi:hypothetical protein